MSFSLFDRIRQNITRLRFAPFLSQLVITRRCNLACGYCSEYDNTSEPVPLAILQSRVDRLAELGSFGLEFTGGEPLLHPDLPALVRYAGGHPWKMLGLITNGYLLSDAVIDELNEAKLTDMQISVDGVEPNKTTTKVLRPLRRKLEKLSNRARFRVVLSAVVGAGATADEIEQVISFARDRGFRPRVLLVHDPNGQLCLGAEELAGYRRIQKLIGFHYKDLFDYRERLITRGEAPFRCRAGSRYLYIDEHGIVHWCSQTMQDFGKPLETYGPQDMREQFYLTKDCNRRCTVGCARSCSMYDGLFPQRLGATVAQDLSPSGSGLGEPPPPAPLAPTGLPESDE